MLADILFAALPILVLIFLMTLPKGLSASKALPLMAVVVWFIALVWFRRDPVAVNAAVISGALTALTPIVIMAGALFMFRAMEQTGAMATISGFLRQVSPNRVAQAMIVGWAFSFLLEGAGGFGTPIALAAPILVGLGFSPLKAAVFTLILNSVPVTFGAVGTPIWFGLSRISGLDEAMILEIGRRSALLHGIASLVIPLVGLLFLVPWKELRRSLGFVYLSIGATVIPYVLLAGISYEFPALVGGLCGTVVSVLAARLGWGLPRESAAPASTTPDTGWREVIKAGFPIWACTLYLIISRLDVLGLKGLLNAAEPAVQLSLGTLGNASISPALVLGFDQILGSNVHWSFKALYVPGILPFVPLTLISLWWYRSPRSVLAGVARDTAARLAKPSLALVGALIFVEIMMLGGEGSAVSLTGQALASATGGAWQFFASLLGAIGAFFSGSNTVANLTFGGIQHSMAVSLGLDPLTILALQSTGGAYGHMVAIGPVLSACAMLGLKNQEGELLRKVAPALLLYAVIVGLASFLPLW